MKSKWAMCVSCHWQVNNNSTAKENTVLTGRNVRNGSHTQRLSSVTVIAQ